jgi:hypothetical protein
MALSEDITHAVSVTTSTMLAEDIAKCDLALNESDYFLVVKGTPEHNQAVGEPQHEFPMSGKVFVLYHK